ncbi:BMP family ABC transporter substrate-binding protein [Agrobacterium larrymoorei]|uniref:BMP family ABC transporter substrate-binding protein n=1 Tax=Agrobacterium larrymoorei TaxID=160699 RepID=A0A4D7E584_9HYPH|nr:BMP family ABC transporter substrate-binding protein [Agrobacterium larrymoorei]QCJ01217.1 BMP family ABC transporter substrate-binding protein [Agrobacterium larrymoorei]QYA10413.1 BMP family ABC transporter substrate-binding protein [Agrobacterium larrymoorei]
MNRRTFLQGSAGAVAMGVALSAIPDFAGAAEGLVALVHTQAAGDNGPVDQMIAKLKQLSQEKGFEHRAIYAQDPATYEAIFRTLGDAGAAIVISTFNGVSEPFKALAPSYPQTKWIQLFGDAFNPPIANVVTVSYDYHLGCYLSGVFAAHITTSGKIGYVGGVSLPQLNADFNALKAGALSVRPEANVTSAFAGSFQDPAKGQEIATQMYNSGIDYIQTDAAATDSGIIAAANEKDGRLVSSISPSQYALGPKSVVSIVSLDFGVSLYNEISKALTSGWKGGTHEKTGLGNGVIDFIASPVFAEQSAGELAQKAKAAMLEVEKVRAGILDGSIVVPFNTTI